MGEEPRGLVRLSPAHCQRSQLHGQGWGHRGRRGTAPLSHEYPLSQGLELFPLKPFVGERRLARIGEVMGKGRTRHDVSPLSSSCSGSKRDEREVLGLLWLHFYVQVFHFQET